MISHLGILMENGNTEGVMPGDKYFTMVTWGENFGAILGKCL
jgi:hypothetical protein